MKINYQTYNSVLDSYYTFFFPYSDFNLIQIGLYLCLTFSKQNSTTYIPN